MSEETDPTISTEEPLVFDKAEPTAAAPPPSRCRACKRPLGREHFTIDEAECCEDCHHLVSHQLKEAKGGMAFLRAAGIGLVAALGGSIAWYAVAKITGMEIGRRRDRAKRQHLSAAGRDRPRA